MKVIKEQTVKVFGQYMIVQLVEYDIDTTHTTWPYDGSDGKKTKTVTKLKFKNKFVLGEQAA